MNTDAARDLWLTQQDPLLKLLADRQIDASTLPEANVIVPIFNEDAPHKDLVGGPVFDQTRWPTKLFTLDSEHPLAASFSNPRKLNEEFTKLAYKVDDECRDAMGLPRRMRGSELIQHLEKMVVELQEEIKRLKDANG